MIVDGDGLRFDAKIVDVVNRGFTFAGVIQFCFGVKGVLNNDLFGV